MSESYHPTGRQLAAGRVLLGLDQPTIAAASKVSIPTLRRMEASHGAASGLPNNVEAVRRALEQAGVEFLHEDEENGLGVRLRKNSVFG